MRPTARLASRRAAAWLAPSAALVVATLLGAPARADIALRVIVSGLSQPVAFVQDPARPDVQYIVEKGGRIRVLNGGVLEAADFLDLTAVVLNSGERGLLGLAFPPDYGDSRRFFVNFVNKQGHTVIARFLRSTADPLVADPASRFDLRWPDGQRFIVQPYANHNGGTLKFGPDGYLYVGMGDGGSSNDPHNFAQSPSSLLGKMLRIDVGVAAGDVIGYRIPADNPFVDNVPVAALDEIWAFGLRNPWKFSFDDRPGGTGGLLIADVGQSSREEVNFEPAATGGRNYGWRIREGTVAGSAPAVAAYLPLTDPIHDYSHAVGQSVTGGVVYRGAGLDQALQGRYFFGDFIAGRIFSLGLAYVGGQATVQDVVEHTGELGGSGTIGLPSSIDHDADGEVYVVDFRGAIRRIERAERLTLSVTGAGSIRSTLPVAACTSTCTHSVLAGTAVRLTPSPAPGWVFAGWTGAADCTDGIVVMDAARSCGASFLARLTARSPQAGLDLNGDGRGDVFTYSPTTGAWSAALNGATSIAGTSSGLWARDWTIRSGDFNADGLSDLFLYNRTTGQWFKALQTPSGVFSFTTQVWKANWEVTVLDLTGDRRADVLLYDRTTGQWFTCVTTAAGGFVYRTGFWEPGFTVFKASLDGNQWLDAFLYDEASGRWFRATSNGLGEWSQVQSGLWKAGWSVHIGDFNADLRSDVFLYDPLTGQWFVCTTLPTGFSYVTGLWARNWMVRTGDFDGNGRADVFLYNALNGQWFRCLTTVPGTFSYLTANWEPGGTIQVNDFNGDRRSDVLFYHPVNGHWQRADSTTSGFQITAGTWDAGLAIVVD